MALNTALVPATR